METVSFLSDAFTLFLHLLKKKGDSGSRDGWYSGLITTNASLQNTFEEEGATGSSSSEADAMLSRLQVVAQKPLYFLFISNHQQKYRKVACIQ